MTTFRLRGMWRSLAGAMLVTAAACSPLIQETRMEPLAEGSPKTVEVDIRTRFCEWRAPSRVRIRRSDATAWTELPTPSRTSGDYAFLHDTTWRTTVPGSDAYLQGESYIVQWTVPFWGGQWFDCPPSNDPLDAVHSTTLVVTAPFALGASPGTVALRAGGTAPLTVGITRYGAFAGPVTVSIGGLPSGVTASPAAVAATGASASFTLSAGTTAPLGSHQAAATGTSPGRTTQHAAFTVAISRPAISSISPPAAPHGGTVTIHGSGFDSTCADNLVTIAGIVARPTSCPPDALNATVPAAAPYGTAQVFVTSAGVVSNSLTLSVARDPGPFVEITDDIRGQVASRACSTGAVSLAISGSYLATYRVAGGAVIGSIAFEADTPLMTPTVGDTPVDRWVGAGGAGFSLCTTGVVLDPDARNTEPHVLAYRFLRLDDGSKFTKSFDYYTRMVGVDYGSVEPALYRSPDGTVFVAVVASTQDVTKAALVIDRQSGQTLRTVELGSFGGTFSASITPANAVAISFAGTSFSPVPIP